MAELSVHQSVLLTDLALCVNRWRLFSPGWYVCVLAKVPLSPEESELPGLVAMVNYGRKKQCEAHDDAFRGPPNLVLDVGCRAAELPSRTLQVWDHLNGLGRDYYATHFRPLLDRDSHPA
jgi:hypothetical protein